MLCWTRCRRGVVEAHVRRAKPPVVSVLAPIRAASKTPPRILERNVHRASGRRSLPWHRLDRHRHLSIASTWPETSAAQDEPGHMAAASGIWATLPV
jgi:hypothetical protein